MKNLKKGRLFRNGKIFFQKFKNVTKIARLRWKMKILHPQTFRNCQKLKKIVKNTIVLKLKIKKMSKNQKKNSSLVMKESIATSLGST